MVSGNASAGRTLADTVAKGKQSELGWPVCRMYDHVLVLVKVLMEVHERGGRISAGAVRDVVRQVDSLGALL